MKRLKNSLILISTFIAILIISGFLLKIRIQNQVKDLFKMNKLLQEEGYFMAEFEFQLMNILYNIDKGKYLHALSMISEYHKKLTTKHDLIKLPAFKNKQEEIDFYLKLQNPETGAFINSEAPYFLYWPITENILNHIEDLQDSISGILQLNYPLNFLDSINTPQKLETYLNDLSYVGWLAPKFPMTSFIFVRELASCARENNVLTRNNLYSFSPQWKHAFTKWMYNFQDEETGFWGPKNRHSGKIAMEDLDNTASILKLFRDNNGNDLNKEFPLKHKEKLFKSTLDILKTPYPDEKNLSKIHAWNLKVSKGSKMLLRHLWKDASEKNKKEARLVFTDIVCLGFEKYYIESDGAFSYYPNADHASCDGMTNFYLKNMGALSYKKQKEYWGDPESNAKNRGTFFLQKNDRLTYDFLDTLSANSVRVYDHYPNFSNLTDSVYAVFYPHRTTVPDITEIVPNIVSWAQTSNLSMGNWTSMADIRNQFETINIKKPLILKDHLPSNKLNGLLSNSSEIYFVGFDILQIPEFIICFKLIEE